MADRAYHDDEPRFTQVAVCRTEYDEAWSETVVALDTDGVVWRHDVLESDTWKPLPRHPRAKVVE